MWYIPPHAICAIIPSLVKWRSPRIRISVVIIRIVRIGPPYEKNEVSGEEITESEGEFCVAIKIVAPQFSLSSGRFTYKTTEDPVLNGTNHRNNERPTCPLRQNTIKRK